MKDKKTIDEYTAAFKNLLQKRLKKGIGIKCVVHPAEEAGAVLEFILVPKGEQQLIEYKPAEETVNDVLKRVEQKLVGGDISNVTFAGTNISMEGNKIILIKGEDDLGEWDEGAARSDLNRIFHPSFGSSDDR